MSDKRARQSNPAGGAGADDKTVMDPDELQGTSAGAASADKTEISGEVGGQGHAAPNDRTVLGRPSTVDSAWGDASASTPRTPPAPGTPSAQRPPPPTFSPPVTPTPTSPTAATRAASNAPSATPTPGGPVASAAHTPVHATPSETTATGVSLLPEPGTKLNQYELIREIGRGGMGAVFLARDTKLGRRVAIKFLQTQHPELSKRFIVEARATARCQHENIVIIYEVGEWGGSPYMVLEYLKGHTLTKLIEGGQKLPPQRAVQIMIPVVKALQIAHEQGIVHRDLKPDNIFITETGSIKVLDFGIAKVLQGEEQARDYSGSGSMNVPADDHITGNVELTRHGAIMGTMSYMSPEQWGIGVDIDHRTDIWATGIMLYRMIAGKHPLAPLRGQQLVITAALDRAMPRLRENAPDAPESLGTVIDRCLMKRKEQRFGSAGELLRALEPFQPGRFQRKLQVDQSPYAGLAAFQEADANRFFGRSREIAAFVTRIRDNPIMAVVGPSGVGKSSFVRAGVVPGLKQSGENWETLVIRPGRNPLGALAAIVSPMIGSSTTLEDDISEQAEIVNRLRREPGYLGAVLRSRARREGHKILVFIDQFEELYTLIPDPAERMAFTACLTGVADDPMAPLRVVLSIRSDFLDRVPEDQQFMSELSQGLFFLTAPNRDGLRDALVQPAEIAGYHFESTIMVEDMLDHLESTPGALPLLQFAATKLWDSRDAGRKLLTQRSYEAIGGIAGALASHADSVLQELSPRAQALVRSIFLRLVTPERTRQIVNVAELHELSNNPTEIQRLVDHLVQARLLTVQTGGESGGSVEIVHESLIHTWPMLRRWLDENQDDAAFLEQLRNAAKQWKAKGYDAGLLWRGEMLEEARRFAKRYRGELPELQRRYLEEVFNLGARATRRKRWAVIAAFGLMSVLIAAAAVALVVIRSSEKEASEQRDVAKKAERVAKAAELKATQRADELNDKKQELEEQKAQLQELVEQKQGLLDKVDKTQLQLAERNQELEEALEKAEKSKRRAKRAKERAERDEERAKLAEARAKKALAQVETAKKEVDELLEKERKRVEQLRAALKSPIENTLK